MKHLLFIALLSALLFSCASEPAEKTISEKTEDVKKESCTYALLPGGSANLTWTAFKFTEKVGVSGTFDQCRIGGNKNISSDLTSILNGSQFIIQTGTINSKNPERDAKIVKSFFGTMKDGNSIFGKITDAKGTNRAGRCNALVTMNGLEKEVNLTYTLKESMLSLTGSLDLATWNGLDAVASLNEVCDLLHKGADGKSKLWPNIDIAVVGEIKVTCPE